MVLLSFKSENVFFKSVLSSRSENTGPVNNRGHVKSSQMRSKAPLQLFTPFPLRRGRYNNSVFLEAKLINVL